MVAFRSVALVSLPIIGALASPFHAPNLKHEKCMSSTDAQQVAYNFGRLVTNYSAALANVALAPNLTEYSDSVDTVIASCPETAAIMALPLMSLTLSNSSQSQTGQGQQQPINFYELDLWEGCYSVTLRWASTNTVNVSDVRPIVGLVVMDTVPAPAGNPYPYLISSVYSEFDTSSWLQNLQEAGVCGTQNATSTNTGTSNSTATGTSNSTATGSSNSTATGSSNSTDTGSSNSTDTGSSNSTATGSSNSTDTGSSNSTDTGSSNSTDTGSSNATDTGSSNSTATLPTDGGAAATATSGSETS